MYYIFNVQKCNYKQLSVKGFDPGIIELVIKLPEDEYQNILLTGKASFCTVNAIEAGTLLPKRLLEQEPVLNKIRDEIEQLPITDTAIRLVTEIIDKYKTESEK